MMDHGAHSDTPVGTTATPRWRVFFAHSGLALLAFTALSVAMTWPLTAHLTEALAGDRTDPWQTVWGFWWWRHSLSLGHSPMYSRLLWWPDGAPLWLQTWDLPSTFGAVVTAPLTSIVTAYNLALLASFPLSGLTMYALCRALWGNALGAFCAGCLYTFSTYHFSHAVANLHIASMQWVPLYVFGLVVIVRGGGQGAAVLTGLGLALAAMTSPYYLAFSGIVSVTLLACWVPGLPSSAYRRLAIRLAMATIVFSITAGWMLVGMAIAYTSERYTGSHNPLMFSADLQSFLTPNPISRWSDSVGFWKEWNSSGSIWVSAAYIGWIPLVLALTGAARDVVAKHFVIVAVMGAVLAIGPHIQIAGRLYTDFSMPYAWLEWLAPALSFGGLPGRFAWLTAFGISVASGAALSELCRRSRRRAALAVFLTAVSLVEVSPRPFQMTMFDRPAIMGEWASDRESWAVLDATWLSRALWHQTIHQHPILGGYLTRTPVDLANALRREPIAAALMSRWLQVPEPTADALDSATAVKRLRDLRIRYVVVDIGHASRPRQWGLTLRFANQEIAIYELVPAVSTTRSVSPPDDRRADVYRPSR